MSRRSSALALLGYLLLSMLLVGRHTVADPSHACACAGGPDPATYMWALRWWPYALIHGTNPFFTHLLWAPNGANVAAAALIPLPSVLLYPLTAAFGPIVSYNALVILSPAVASSTAYLLCLRVGTGGRPAAFAGGYAFGFGSYELSQSLGHPNLMLVALLPLFVLVVLQRESMSRRRYIVVMGALLSAQLLTSTEVLAGTVLFGLLALTLARAVRRVAVDTMLAGALAATLCSPYLLYSVLRAVPHGPADAGNSLASDLFSFVVPQPTVLFGGGSFDTSAFHGGVVESGAYFGLLLLVAVLLYLWQERRSSSTRVIAGVSGAAVVAALGSHLFVNGSRTIPLPWDLLARLPVLENVVPSRLIVYAWLAVAVALSLWLGMRTSPARWALVVAGLVLIAPDAGYWNGDLVQPALFSTTAYRHALKPHEVVLVLPFGTRSANMLWQAQTDMYFRMPEGYLSGVPPAEFVRGEPLAETLITGGMPAGPQQLAGFLTRHSVGHVVVEVQQPGGWAAQLTALGWHEQPIGGTLLFSPPASGP